MNASVLEIGISTEFEALDFYAAQAGPLVALRFLAEVERVVNLLVEYPDFGTPASRGRRVYPPRVFPYSIVYRVSFNPEPSMHPASNSVKYFGLYAIATGSGLVFAPGLVLSPLGIAVPTEIWIRVVGALAVPVGYYYWHCGSANVVEFFRASVRGRILFAAIVVLLVALYAAPVKILLFAAIDVAGAVWTAYGLRKAAIA